MSELSIPESDLQRVLGEWSGVGDLWRALAAMGDVSTDREWSQKDVERRAMRVLLLECAPLLSRWPSNTRSWMDQLPVVSAKQRFWSVSPEPKVDWGRTVRRGWPPNRYAIRRRHRSTDQLTLSVLAWTLEELRLALNESNHLVGPAASGVASLPVEAQKSLAAVLPLLDYLEPSDARMPDRDDLAALRGVGRPWGAVADVARLLVELERGGALAFSKRLIRPDGFPDRLFQLAVLGSVLAGAENVASKITSLRPIGYMTDGPVYRIEDPHGREWDLWCEAAHCWEHYAARDTYQRLARGLAQVDGAPFRAGHLRPDVLLALPSERALVLECKYPMDSLSPGYVASGLPQALLYGQQLAPYFRRIAAVSVGPKELVPSTRQSRISGVRVGYASPEGVRELVASALTRPPR